MRRSTERHLGGRLAKIWCITLGVREKKGSRVGSWTDGEHWQEDGEWSSGHRGNENNPN